MYYVCLFLFYILATSEVISGWVPTCDSAHSWWLHSAASLGHQTAGTRTCYPTQSHYPDTEPTGPCPILIMPSARLGSDKYKFKVIGLTRPEFKAAGSGLESMIFRFPDLPEGEVSTLLIQPPWLVVYMYYEQLKSGLNLIEGTLYSINSSPHVWRIPRSRSRRVQAYSQDIDKGMEVKPFYKLSCHV